MKISKLKEYLDGLLDEAKYHKEQGRRSTGQVIISIVYDIEQILLQKHNEQVCRSHPIIKCGNLWFYVDDNSPVVGPQRPCRKCDQPAPLNELDPCLGMLPGVTNTCCGHGTSAESYNQFENGVHTSGFTHVEQPCPRCKLHKDHCECTSKD